METPPARKRRPPPVLQKSGTEMFFEHLKKGSSSAETALPTRAAASSSTSTRLHHHQQREGTDQSAEAAMEKRATASPTTEETQQQQSTTAKKKKKETQKTKKKQQQQKKEKEKKKAKDQLSHSSSSASSGEDEEEGMEPVEPTKEDLKNELKSLSGKDQACQLMELIKASSSANECLLFLGLFNECAEEDWKNFQRKQSSTPSFVIQNLLSLLLQKTQSEVQNAEHWQAQHSHAEPGHEIVASLLNAISLYSHSDLSKETIIEKGGVPVLLRCMKHYPTNMAVQRNVAAILLNLSIMGAKEVIQHEPGIQVILESMRNHTDDFFIQLRLCAVLRNLMVRHADHRRQIVEQGGVAMVVASMAAHIDNSNMQENACIALRTMLHEAGPDDKLQKEGVMEATRAAHQRYPENEWINEIMQHFHGMVLC
ncbi:hypothetical protein QOT17_002534 [Balamuthia mandrillaris]